MKRKIIAAMVSAAVAFGIAAPAGADDWRKESGCKWVGACDGPNWRDRDRDWRERDRDWRHRHREWRERRRDWHGRDDWRHRRDWYGRGPTYEPVGSCTFRSRRGPIPGYRPAGKDRCCIETSQGPSCQ